MHHGLGEVIANYGFNFFEKIHESVFSLTRLGRIKRLNEAARKLLKIANINRQDFERFSRSQIETLIAQSYGGSDLVLVELRK
jgi:sensor histidine kinase regulating citrate/malate metabolism